MPPNRKPDNNFSKLLKKIKHDFMKTKMLVTAIASLFSTVLFAQKMTHDEGHTTFGVRAGVNFNTITGKNENGDKLDNGIKTGFNLGVNAEVPLSTGSYLQPGILYSQKGAKLKNTGASDG